VNKVARSTLLVLGVTVVATGLVILLGMRLVGDEILTALVEDMLAGGRGTGAYLWPESEGGPAEKRVMAYAPVYPAEGCLWSVGTSVPYDTILTAYYRIHTTLLWTGGIVIAILLAGGALLARADRERAVAEEQARAAVEIERRNREQMAIYQVGLTAASTLNLGEVLTSIYEQVAKMMPCDGFYIALYDEEREELHFEIAREHGKELGPLTRKLGNGLTGWIVRSGNPLLIRDVGRELESLPVVPEQVGEMPASWLGLPLVVRDKVIGVISVQSFQPHAFDEDDQCLLASLVSQAVVAIENARLYEQTRQHAAWLEKQTRNLEVVRQVSSLVSSSLDPEHILLTVAKQMVRLFEVDHSSILLFDQEYTWGQVVAEYPPGEVTGERMPVHGYPAAERIIARPEPLMIADVQHNPLMAPVRDTVFRLGTQSMLILPLVVKGRVIGSIGLDAISERRILTQEEIELAQTIANQVANAIENARLHEESLRRAAALDRHGRQLKVLLETLQALSAELNLDTLLQQIVERAVEVVPGAQKGSLLIRKGDVLTYRGAVGYDLAQLQEIQIPFDHHPFVGALAQGETVETLRLAEHDRETLPPKVTEKLRRYGRTDEIKVLLSAPIFIAGELAGYLNVDNLEREDAFDEEAHEILRLFASQAAVAIANASLFQETHRRAAQLDTINRIGRRAASLLDRQELLQTTVDAIQRELGYYQAAVLLLDEDTHDLFVAAATDNFWQIIPESHRQQLGQGLIGAAAQTGQTVLANDALSDPRLYDGGWVSPASLSAPIKVGEEVIGVLEVEDRVKNVFDRQDVAALEVVADQLAVALENARLYHELQARAEALNQAYNELQNMTVMRSRFMQTASHDLRAPLSLIMGHAEVLASGELGILLDEQVQSLEVIIHRVYQMRCLVNDLAAILELEEERELERKPVSLLALAQETVTEFQAVARQAGLTMALEVSTEIPPITGERRLLQRVVDNLINNALKFTSQGGVTVRLGCAEDMVWLAVEDTGPGIPPEERERIFDRFYQVEHPLTQRRTGTGLGLAVVKEVIERHGGRVTLESEVGKGSTFTVWLPIASAHT